MAAKIRKSERNTKYYLSISEREYLRRHVKSHYNRGHFYNAHPKVFVTYKGGNNHRDVRFYADRKVTKPAVHHAPTPAPHHPKAPVKVDKRHGISNHTLANNTPRHVHNNAGHFGRR